MCFELEWVQDKNVKTALEKASGDIIEFLFVLKAFALRFGQRNAVLE